MCPTGDAGRARDTVAVGCVAILRPDTGLNNVNWSDFVVNQSDFAGDDIARQARHRSGMVGGR